MAVQITDKIATYEKQIAEHKVGSGGADNENTSWGEGTNTLFASTT